MVPRRLAHLVRRRRSASAYADRFMVKALFVFASVMLFGLYTIAAPQSVGVTQLGPSQNHQSGDIAHSHDATRSLLVEKSDTSNYPPEKFTDEQLSHGAVILHVIGVCYTFVALAIVCDEFFVPALEIMYVGWGVSDDVAGATFMAAGGSAPELATSFIGTFIAKSAVGFGTIVGSAVFNVLFVIGLCAIFSKDILALTWWPLFRDTMFYAVDLLLLVAFFFTGSIDWYESLILLIMYFAYVIFMKFNAKIEKFVKVKILKQEFNPEDEVPVESPVVSQLFEHKGSTRALRHVSFKSGALHLMLHEFGAKGRGADRDRDSRFRRAASIVMEANRALKQSTELRATKSKSMGSLHDPGAGTRLVEIETATPADSNDATKSVPPLAKETSKKKVAIRDEDIEAQNVEEHGTDSDEMLTPRGEGNVSTVGKDDDGDDDDDDEEDTDLLSWPSTTKGRMAFIFFFPILLLLGLTLPNPQKEKWKKWYLATFFGSILWIAVFSYGMVWWATIIGNTAGIPAEVMGLTFLAAGTSVPDLISSVLVARQGLGDMAVSSSIGSNIFDVTVGLPLPWLIWSIANNGDAVGLDGSDSLGSSVLILFIMLLAVIVTIALSKWKMTRLLGWIMFGLYVIFLTFAILLAFEQIPSL
eukprot:TRINITY_DN36551_c0_g1_i1.p1 TRINITY_DN36551_c0_g1~~TRINITY_DN36551_c0_g1_i1.p1  ORF type:complete len:643 (-),score=63.86 TRINITY_DN36551_c0_g1_i1:92-2020(-)